MKIFKSTASKIKNPSFFFNKSADVILNKSPPASLPGGARVGGAVHPGTPSYASEVLNVPDFNATLNAFLMIRIRS